MFIITYCLAFKDDDILKYEDFLHFIDKIIHLIDKILV